MLRESGAVVPAREVEVRRADGTQARLHVTFAWAGRECYATATIRHGRECYATATIRHPRTHKYVRSH